MSGQSSPPTSSTEMSHDAGHGHPQPTAIIGTHAPQQYRANADPTCAPPKGEEDFKTPLVFQCCYDCESCITLCCGCLCPCWIIDNTETFQARGDANVCCGDCGCICHQSCHALCCWFCGGCCWYGEQRTQLQLRYGILPTAWKNLCLSCFCLPCTLSQQYIEVKHKGVARSELFLQSPQNPYERIYYHPHVPTCCDCDCFFPIFGNYIAELPRWKVPYDCCTSIFTGNSHCMATRLACCCCKVKEEQ